MADGKSKNTINKLPDHVISSIVALMTIKDAVYTSMISHQWKDSWKHPILSRPNLEFDIPNIFGTKLYGQLFNEFGDKYIHRFGQFEGKVFVGRVNEFLKLYHGKKVDSFKVSFPLDGVYNAVLDKWILFAIRKGAQVLDLQLLCCGLLETNFFYVFPHWFLSGSLKHLSLLRCVLRPPPDFARFNELTTLSLNNVIIDEEFVAHLSSVCLCLTRLTLRECSVGSCLILGDPLLCLTELKVLQCSDLAKLEIHCKNITSLEYEGLAETSYIKTKCLARIFWSDRSFNDSSLHALTQLASCPGLECLHLRLWFSVEEIPENVQTFTNLKQLHLDLFSPHLNVSGVLVIIKAAPLLEEFVLMVRASIHNEVRSIRRKMSILARFSHLCLRKVKIHGFQGRWYEIELAICILKIAKKMEIMVIDPIGKYYAGVGEWKDMNDSRYSYEEEAVVQVEEAVGEAREDTEAMEVEEAVKKAEAVDETGDKDGWEERGRAFVEKNLRQVMTDAQVIVL
ncbi:F-box/FBD/LRR-repeat protein At5g22660-like [Rosa rugosa]|uniref:F-box/FBD/LRR-repeat protein At5g22660-like n=1 Tax=Rosa rugosa TaxID=74645 RepID=UPI002B405A80|nr:F-box/FBD/LRR-repeat protein At5g22660-like [Rosa rugosa]